MSKEILCADSWIITQKYGIRSGAIPMDLATHLISVKRPLQAGDEIPILLDDKSQHLRGQKLDIDAIWVKVDAPIHTGLARGEFYGDWKEE